MPRATTSDLLNGPGRPRLPTVIAFVRCCQEYARKNTKASNQDSIYDEKLWTEKYRQAFAAGDTWIRFGTLPARAACYQPRPGQVRLEQTLAQKRTAVLQDATQPATNLLSGMGGVGKTQIALAYASKVWNDPELALAAWVRAGSRKDILDSYARLAARLLGSDAGEPQQAAADLLEWLQNTDQTWLVVFDGLDDPEDLTGLWPPTTVTGHTIVTTRYRGASFWGGNRAVIRVEVFTREESNTYLSERLHDKPELLDGAELLAEKLGNLPLALAHAAAFMWDRDLTARKYCVRFTDTRRKLLDLFPGRGKGPDEHLDTVATTWSISIDNADEQPPKHLARPLLAIASLLSPNGIPADMFNTAAILGHLRTSLGREVDADDVHDGLRILHRLHLITADLEPDRTVYVHSLVQRATREAIPSAELAALGQVAASALDQASPDIDAYVDLELVHALRSNADTLDAQTGIELITVDSGPHALLTTIGHSLGRAGMPNEARTYFQNLMQKTVEILGENHLETLKIRGHAASWLGHSKRWSEAFDEFNALYRDFCDVAGEEHLETIKARASRASYQARSGHVAEAIPELEIILGLRERLLGPFHPDTLTVRARLANWHGETGRPQEAIDALESLLADYYAYQRKDVRSIFLTRASIAKWRGINGAPAVAAAEYKALLHDRLAIYRSDHPDTITTRKSLIRWYRAAGDRDAVDAAEKELIAEESKILAKQEALYSPNHPDALARRASLTRSQARGVGNGRIGALPSNSADHENTERNELER